MIKKEEFKGNKESADHGCSLRRCPQCGYVVADSMVTRCPRCWGPVPALGCDVCGGCKLGFLR